MNAAKITPKTLEALKLLEGTTVADTRRAKVLASLLWPDRMKECVTSARRNGLYRATGAYYSKLQKEGLVGHWVDDFSSGYYITEHGRRVLSGNS